MRRLLFFFVLVAATASVEANRAYAQTHSAIGSFATIVRGLCGFVRR